MKFNKEKFDLIRAKKGLTVQNIVDNANVAYKTLCADNIGPIPLGKIAKYLKVDPEELIIKDTGTHQTTKRINGD